VFETMDGVTFGMMGLRSKRGGLILIVLDVACRPHHPHCPRRGTLPPSSSSSMRHAAPSSSTWHAAHVIFVVLDVAAMRIEAIGIVWGIGYTNRGWLRCLGAQLHETRLFCVILKLLYAN